MVFVNDVGFFEQFCGFVREFVWYLVCIVLNDVVIGSSGLGD